MKSETNSVFKKFFINNALKENDILFLVYEILSIYNCRISEILNAKWKDFYPEQYLILEGLKKSRNVIVRDRAILNKINKLVKVDNILIFKYVTYNNVYHFIKNRLGNELNTIKVKKNKKITHFYRYKNVCSLDNDKKIRDILNHSSLQSGTYYKNKIKGK